MVKCLAETVYYKRSWKVLNQHSRNFQSKTSNNIDILFAKLQINLDDKKE